MEAPLKKKRYTYEDYCSWEYSGCLELIDGVPYIDGTAYLDGLPNAMAPGASERHQTISGEIFSQLHTFLRGKPCKVLHTPFDVRLSVDEGDTVVQPDILVVCDLSKLKGGKGVDGAPDLIIEILSPSSVKNDLVTKKRLYLQSGVREYWIIDPESRIATTHILHELGYISRSYDEHDTEVPVEVLDGCTINFAEVFEGL